MNVWGIANNTRRPILYVGKNKSTHIKTAHADKGPVSRPYPHTGELMTKTCQIVRLLFYIWSKLVSKLLRQPTCHVHSQLFYAEKHAVVSNKKIVIL